MRHQKRRVRNDYCHGRVVRFILAGSTSGRIGIVTFALAAPFPLRFARRARTGAPL